MLFKKKITLNTKKIQEKFYFKYENLTENTDFEIKKLRNF